MGFTQYEIEASFLPSAFRDVPFHLKLRPHHRDLKSLEMTSKPVGLSGQGVITPFDGQKNSPLRPETVDQFPACYAVQYNDRRLLLATSMERY